MEASRYFEWIEFDYRGNWDAVTNKWEWRTPDKGKKYQVATYRPVDEVGLEVTMRFKRKDRSDPDALTLQMSQMWPRNSTLWATDPRTQATYVIRRRACTIYAPHVLGGMKYEDDYDEPPIGPDRARDVTPKGGSPQASADKLKAFLAAEKAKLAQEGGPSQDEPPGGREDGPEPDEQDQQDQPPPQNGSAVGDNNGQDQDEGEAANEAGHAAGAPEGETPQTPQAPRGAEAAPKTRITIILPGEKKPLTVSHPLDAVTAIERAYKARTAVVRQAWLQQALRINRPWIDEHKALRAILGACEVSELPLGEP
jgi:hypothetical protein